MLVTAPAVTKPENTKPIAATLGVLLLQVPMPVASSRVVVAPTQRFRLPDIGKGVWFTVTIVAIVQPAVEV